MMSLNSLTDWLRKRIPGRKSAPQPNTQLRLEELEDRVVPSTIFTYTNASVAITPGFTVTETVTATVTNFQGISFVNGQFVPQPIPSGAPSPTQGNVNFNLNNMQATAPLNGNGQATATFQVPLLAFLTSQTLQVKYEGFNSTTSPNAWVDSTFTAPLYKNFDNVLLPGTLTFNQLTPQQVYAEDISSFSNQQASGNPFATATALSPFYTAQGETDNVGNGLIIFNYTDPGNINTLTALGIQLPGIFALQLGAYNGFNFSSSSSNK